VDGDSRDLAEDPVAGKRLGPVRVDREARRIGIGLHARHVPAARENGRAEHGDGGAGFHGVSSGSTEAEYIPAGPTRKEPPMKPLLWAALALLCASAYAQSVPTIPFDASDPLVMPKDLYLGEATGVAVNSKGHIFVLSRGNTTGPAYGAAATQLLEFDALGKFVREIGHNLYAWSFGHTVRIDRGDNIWVTDKG